MYAPQSHYADRQEVGGGDTQGVRPRTHRHTARGDHHVAYDAGQCPAVPDAAIQVAIEQDDAELLTKVREAVAEVAGNWRARPRAANRPIVSLAPSSSTALARNPSEILDTDDLRTSLAEARRIALEAPGGAGKTTTLVQLATDRPPESKLHFLSICPRRIRSGTDVLEFIARTPAFRSHNISAADLARLAKNQHFSFLLNGWNEIAEVYSDDAVVALAQLERDFPAAGIVVATRTHYISPPLPGAFRVKLLPFNRRQRAEYLRQALGDRTDELRLQLEGNRILDDLTRTPLILAEVTTIFQAGGPIPTTRIGVLGAVMQLIESSDEHRPHLQNAPLANGAHHYLKELAAQMIARGEVVVAEDAARSSIQSVTARLHAKAKSPPHQTPRRCYMCCARTMCWSRSIIRLPRSDSNISSFRNSMQHAFWRARWRT